MANLVKGEVFKLFSQEPIEESRDENSSKVVEQAAEEIPIDVTKQSSEPER